MDIYFYNTLTKNKEKFEPINKEEVRMYSCGPTVYKDASIGNMRTYIMNDIFTKLFALLYFSGLIILSYSRVSCVLNRIAINITENRNSIIIIDNTFLFIMLAHFFMGIIIMCMNHYSF